MTFNPSRLQVALKYSPTRRRGQVKSQSTLKFRWSTRAMSLEKPGSPSPTTSLGGVALEVAERHGRAPPAGGAVGHEDEERCWLAFRDFHEDVNRVGTHFVGMEETEAGRFGALRTEIRTTG